MIDIELQCRAGFQRALLDGAEMDKEIAGLLLRIGDTKTHAFADHHAGVADLTAGFRVKRRLVQHDRAALARLELVDRRAVLYQRADHAFGGFGLVAEEFGGAEFFVQRKPDRFACGIAAAGPRGARLGALLLHRIGERRLIDADAARFQRILRQVERETIGVVEREGGVAVEHVAFLQGSALLVEDSQSPFERLAEARFFQPQGFLDQVFGTHQIRIGLAHLAHQRPDQAVHQRLAGTEQLRHGASRGA